MSSSVPPTMAGENSLGRTWETVVVDFLSLTFFLTVLNAEKLEWGDPEHTVRVLEKYPAGFDFVLGADIYILLLKSCLL